MSASSRRAAPRTRTRAPTAGARAGRGPRAVPAAIREHIANDPWARALGIELVELAKGGCRATLTLAPHMVNFQGQPHGGVIFSLADTVFGAACNAHGEASVGLSVTISYLAAVAPGSRLVADGHEVKQGRRAGFYDITVTAEDGRVVAVAHCIAQRVGAPLMGDTTGTPGGRRREGSSPASP